MTSSWAGPGLPAQWSAAARPAFVGRANELAVLEEAWTSAVAGARQVVFIGGEPGAGKTRLMTEVAVETHRLGAMVLPGRCVADLGLPYEPFDGPARALLDAMTQGVLVPTPEAVEVAEVVRHLSVLAGAADPQIASTPRIDERRVRYDAFLSGLRAAADERPVVLVLDDVHRSGTTALQLLGYLVERTPELRLLLLATHRTTLPDRSADLLDQVASLYRLDGVRRLDLAPLDTDSIADYLVAEGRVARVPATQAAVLLRDHTGGNPFYLREVWRHLRDAGGVGAVRDELGRTPQAVDDALAQRIRALSAGQATTLTVCAVLGEEVTASEVVPLVRAADSLPALDDLVSAGLLDDAPGQSGSYRFVHSLVRQAALDALPSLERAEHHERVAILLEQRGANVRRLAHHFAEASLLGHNDEAVRYLDASAEAADRSLAYAEAARLFEQSASYSTDSATRDAALMRAARSHLLACRFQESRALSGALVERSDPALRLAAAIEFEEASWFTGHSGPDVLALLTAGIAAYALVEGDPLHVPALAGLARSTAQSGDQDGAETLVAQAIAAARAAGDDVLLGRALAAAMQVGTRPTVNAAKRARAEELTGIATRTGQWLFLGPAAYHRSTLAYQAGDAAGLASARIDLERTMVAAGQRYWAYLADCAAFGTALFEARFEDADRLIQNLFELSSGFTGGERDGLHGVQSFMVRRETGAIEQIRPLITGAEPYEGHWLPALLAVYTELAMAEPARQLLRHILEQPAWDGDRDSARRPATLAFLAEAALALQDRAAAGELRPRLREYSGLNLVLGPFAAVFGAADRYLGELDDLLGRSAPGRWFEAALELDTRTGSVLHRAYTSAAWSAHAHAQGDHALAARLHAEAAESAARHGMVRVAARSALGAGWPRPVPGGLSEREREVMRLLGAGCSNREIARELTISEHTAANHVRNIMTKTGCANRTQAAMFASANGLLD